jgi:hypothetical protein
MEQNTQKQTDNQQIKMNSNSNSNYPINNFNEKPSTQTGIVLNYQINQNINSILGNNQNPQNSTIPPKNINQEIRENPQLNNNQINNIKNMNNMNIKFRKKSKQQNRSIRIN